MIAEAVTVRTEVVYHVMPWWEWFVRNVAGGAIFGITAALIIWGALHLIARGDSTK